MSRTWGRAILGMGCVVAMGACDDASVSDTASEHVDAAVSDEVTGNDRVTESGTSTASAATSSTSSAESVRSEMDAGSVNDAGVPFDSAARTDEQATSASDVAGDATGGYTDASAVSVSLPPVNGGLDYQLGGGYDLPQGVVIVARDRTDSPAPDAYNICYVNGFQVQPGEEDDWDADLLLRDEQGNVVIDEDWDEAMLDVSEVEKRERIAAVVGVWIEQCATDGFQAVEIDNLDTYTRSDGRIAEDDAVDFIARLSTVAHEVGLAIAQKNSVELVSRRDEMGTDFVVSEECNAWEECDGYIESYGSAVLMVEYERADFERGCELYGDEFSIVFRDKNLTPPSSDAYLFFEC